jgi:hypothetical protein
MRTPHLISTIVLYATLTAAPTWARLGETTGECDARYGNPSKVDKEKDGTPVRQYQYGTFLVQVVFMDGKSSCEQFKKNDKSMLSAEEAQRILDVNKGDSDWVYQDDFDDATPESWMRVDGLAKAWTIGKPKMLVVVTKDYSDRKRQEADEVQQKKQQEQEKLLLGF